MRSFAVQCMVQCNHEKSSQRKRSWLEERSRARAPLSCAALHARLGPARRLVVVLQHDGLDLEFDGVRAALKLSESLTQFTGAHRRSCIPYGTAGTLPSETMSPPSVAVTFAVLDAHRQPCPVTRQAQGLAHPSRSHQPRGSDPPFATWHRTSLRARGP